MNLLCAKGDNLKPDRGRTKLIDNPTHRVRTINEENKRHPHLNALSPHLPQTFMDSDQDKPSTSKTKYTYEEAKHRGKLRAQGKRADISDAKFFLVEHLSPHRRPAPFNNGFRDGLPGVMDAGEPAIVFSSLYISSNLCPQHRLR